MSKIKLSGNEVDEILQENSEKYELIEEGEWTQDGKYQTCDVVFKDNQTDKTYMMCLGRSGSYHTDWYYSHDDGFTAAYEVKKVTKTIIVDSWEVVK